MLVLLYVHNFKELMHAQQLGCTMKLIWQALVCPHWGLYLDAELWTWHPLSGVEGGHLRRPVTATRFSRRHLRDKWWSFKVVELASLGQLALPILARPLLSQGYRPGCSINRPGVGSQVPSTLASSHWKPARHSGGRFSGAKRTINSLQAGLPTRRVTQEVTGSCPRSPGQRGLEPVASSVPQILT